MNPLLSLCLTAVLSQPIIAMPVPSPMRAAQGHSHKLDVLKPVFDELNSGHLLTLDYLQKFTGKKFHPVAGEFREFETDFLRNKPIQRVRTCVLKEDDMRVVEFKVNPDRTITPEDVAAKLGRWTREGDESEKIWSEDFIAIYQKDWGEIRFDFKGKSKPILSAVYVSAK